MMTDARPTNVASRLQPPLIAIDHILVNRYLTATSLQRASRWPAPTTLAWWPPSRAPA